jgi:hypothetical protein
MEDEGSMVSFMLMLEFPAKGIPAEMLPPPPFFGDPSSDSENGRKFVYDG